MHEGTMSNMNNEPEMSLQRQFTIQAFNSQANKLTRNDAIQLCKDLFLQLEVQKQTYETLLQKEWKL